MDFQGVLRDWGVEVQALSTAGALNAITESPGFTLSSVGPLKDFTHTVFMARMMFHSF